MTEAAAAAAHAAGVVAPGGTIGVLGGGQLGRMLAMAAARLGLKTHVYCPEPDPPAGDVAARVTTAAYDDAAALAAFAEAVDVATFEFENVPAGTLEALARTRPVAPGPAALAASQDRLAEKDFLNRTGAATAPYAAVDSRAALDVALRRTGVPAILKTRRLGYDGKGQARIGAGDPAELDAAWAALAGAPAILEGFVPFERELSVIVARGRDGRTSCYDPGENVHRDGILRTTTVPARIGEADAAAACALATRIAAALDHVGVMGVEMFVVPGPGPALLVNEIAPRVHNSGHWTIEACAVDQFEQHVRAICGWPLGDGARHADAAMTNLIGDDAAAWAALAAEPGAGLHLYGKGAPRPGRKMGHVTRLTPRRRPGA